MKFQFEEIEDVLYKLFKKQNFTKEKAKLLARIHTESSLDGINSHGINRVPLFIKYIENYHVKVDEEAKMVSSFGSIERWDGKLGPGVINATKCTTRAIDLAKKHGMGLVALRNTNHWIRGGTYGWQAADAGCISILFTNTKPNMPPWGGKESRLGNNPLIISIPRKEGHIVLDMAMSQYSFGKLNDYKLRNEKLPVDGGWDSQGNLSKNPSEILDSERGLPIGYWKGSALSMVLDMLATLLSAGDSTYKIGKKKMESGVSQVFLCIYPDIFNDQNLSDKLIEEIVDYSHSVEPLNPNERTYYPGERTLQNRIDNLKNGIEVDPSVWDRIQLLLNK